MPVSYTHLDVYKRQTYYRYVGDDRQNGGSDDIVTKYTFDFAGRTINAVTLDNTEREVLGVTAAAYTTKDVYKRQPDVPAHRCAQKFA